MIQKEYVVQRSRIKLFAYLFVFIFGFIIFRLFEIEIVKGKYYQDLADGQHWVTRKIPADRGKIYTKDTKTGEKFVLATNKTLDMAYAVPQQIKDKKKVSEELASILSLSKDDIYKLIDNDKVYVPIKHKLTDDEVKKIGSSKTLNGILLSPEEWREYPERDLASQVVGFVDNDGIGRYGIEQYFNDDLTGKTGQVSSERDATGRPIAVSSKIENQAQNGKDIVLTIDRTIQNFAEKNLKDAIDKFKAPDGSIIVMNPSSGEILAMANYPSFDPNDYSKTTDFSAFKNVAVSHVYEPGSIFKIITMAAGLDSGKITPQTKYTDTGALQIGGYTIHNASNKTYGSKNMTQVLEDSINTGTCFVGQQMGDRVYYDYLKKFGFGQKTGIELAGEGSTSLKSFESWRPINFATSTFGQGIAVTPIQFLQAAAVIANGGELVHPTIVSEFVMPDGSTVKPQGRERARIISKEAANEAGAMMVSVVENGHGKAAKISGYRVAGKTGTAQIPATDGTGYLTDTSIGSFILFAPAEDPQFMILVKIDRPLGVQWAESTAAPVAGKLAKEIIEYMEIPPSVK